MICWRALTKSCKLMPENAGRRRRRQSPKESTVTSGMEGV
nr:MAG TPA: hypothetical protein [Caudoviricetes sp.]